MKTHIAKTRLPVVALIMGVLAISAGPAFAGKEQPMMMDRGKVDFNGDGMVSEGEIVTYVQMYFMKMDKDNDKMLSQSEWDSYHDQ